tara:strand:+ start:41201 stop:41548 length:348 start_codon:yes stop_codon:yes gene_type:complete
MKLIKTASGKEQIKMSRKEWQDLGKKAGWTKVAQEMPPFPTQQDQTQQQAPTQQAQPAAEQDTYATMTFARLMEDPTFKQQFDTITQQKAWQEKIRQGWQQLGIPNHPEIAELMN